MQLGYNITFSREITNFGIEITKEALDGTLFREFVHLPFDHLTEFKIIKYINLMQESLTTKLKNHESKNEGKNPNT